MHAMAQMELGPTLAALFGGDSSDVADGIEECNRVSIPPWYIDRCRAAYLGAAFDPDADSRVIGITGTMHGEGKTSLAIGIATAMAADTQERTLLLECDVERPSFHRFFGFRVGNGLSDWLRGSPSSLRVLRGTPLSNLFVIPAGAPPSDPARLFYQLSASTVISDLRPAFRNIVIDLPPMVDIGYSSLASSLADRILLVARYGQSSMADLDKVRYLLGGERLAGIVLNDTSYKTPGWLRRLL